LALGPLETLRAGLVHSNPTVEDLRGLASKDETTTEYGSPSYITQVRNRSARHTYVVTDGRALRLGMGQQAIEPEKAREVARAVLGYLKNQEVVRVDRNMGEGPGAIPSTLYVTAGFARIALMWHKSLFPRAPGDPRMTSVYVPEWPERLIMVDPEEAITLILGTDYFGEAKKSFLRMAMYLAKKEGRLGVHAGGKVLRVAKPGGLDSVGMLLFGLSGTGKTTLTVHDHSLRDPEGVIIRQDDVMMMDPGGSAAGTEDSFYIKTEGLEPSQRVLYDAARHPEAVLENVAVGPGGKVDFLDYTLTTNGRAIVPRKTVEGSDSRVDLDRVDKVVFITRRQDVVGPVARLSHEQGAAFFMLGESIETSAGDPSRAGQSKREVGTNPFIIGPEGHEGNRFLEILRANPGIECFLMNTGAVGPAKIPVAASAAIIREIARGTITWEEDPVWGYLSPREVPGLDLAPYDPTRYLSPLEYKERVNRLKEERIAWLGAFEDLDPSIIRALDR